MDCAEERIGGFVIARCDCPVVLEPFPVVLEPFKEILDEMPGFVERLVVVSLVFTVCFRRDHGFYFSRCQPVQNARVGVIPLVSQKDVGGNIVDQNIRAVQVASLPGRQMKARRIAQCIAGGVDLGAQTSL